MNFPPELQSKNVDAIRDDFQSASPFPHCIMDDFLQVDLAHEVAEEFPTYDMALSMGKETSRPPHEKTKVTVSDPAYFKPRTQVVNSVLSSDSFLQCLHRITKIENLIADQKLVGGGWHITKPGGRLNVHIDFNYDEDKRQYRRLNTFLYLTRNWNSEWGGQLELWDEDVENCVRRIEPLFNRCVIFETSERSFHGVVPIADTAELDRRSFASYHYTKEPPSGFSANHDTVFRHRPGENWPLKDRVFHYFGKKLRRLLSTF